MSNRYDGQGAERPLSPPEPAQSVWERHQQRGDAKPRETMKSDDLSCGPGTIIHGMPDWAPTEPAAQQDFLSGDASLNSHSASVAAQLKYRADAVNLAIHEFIGRITPKGVVLLVNAVLEMDAYIKSLPRAPIQAHSKTEYKRMVEQGANVLPPTGGADTPESNQCCICNWVNVGTANLGDHEKSKWVCQGCCKRLLEVGRVRAEKAEE